MEWTLMVAIIAAVATVVLGIVAAKDIPTVAWWLAGVAIAWRASRSQFGRGIASPRRLSRGTAA